MSYPGRGYSLPEAMDLVNRLNKAATVGSVREIREVKTSMIFSLIDSGMSMRHLYGSWVPDYRDASTPLYQFLFEELDELAWLVLGDWVRSWVSESFDIVEETAVVHFQIQGC